MGKKCLKSTKENGNDNIKNKRIKHRGRPRKKSGEIVSQNPIPDQDQQKYWFSNNKPRQIIGILASKCQILFKCFSGKSANKFKSAIEFKQHRQDFAKKITEFQQELLKQLETLLSIKLLGESSQMDYFFFQNNSELDQNSDSSNQTIDLLKPYIHKDFINTLIQLIENRDRQSEEFYEIDAHKHLVSWAFICAWGKTARDHFKKLAQIDDFNTSEQLNNLQKKSEQLLKIKELQGVILNNIKAESLLKIIEEEKLDNVLVKSLLKVIEEEKLKKIDAEQVLKIIEEEKLDNVSAKSLLKIIEELKLDNLFVKSLLKVIEEKKLDNVSAISLLKVIEQVKLDNVQEEKLQKMKAESLLKITEEERLDYVFVKSLLKFIEEEKLDNVFVKQLLKVIEEEQLDNVSEESLLKVIEEEQLDNVSKESLLKVIEEEQLGYVSEESLLKVIEEKKLDNVSTKSLLKVIEQVMLDNVFMKQLLKVIEEEQLNKIKEEQLLKIIDQEKLDNFQAESLLQIIKAEKLKNIKALMQQYKNCYKNEIKDLINLFLEKNDSIRT